MFRRIFWKKNNCLLQVFRYKKKCQHSCFGKAYPRFVVARFWMVVSRKGSPRDLSMTPLLFSTKFLHKHARPSNSLEVENELGCECLLISLSVYYALLVRTNAGFGLALGALVAEMRCGRLQLRPACCRWSCLAAKIVH